MQLGDRVISKFLRFAGGIGTAGSVVGSIAAVKMGIVDKEAFHTVYMGTASLALGVVGVKAYAIGYFYPENQQIETQGTNFSAGQQG